MASPLTVLPSCPIPFPLVKQGEWGTLRMADFRSQDGGYEALKDNIKKELVDELIERHEAELWGIVTGFFTALETTQWADPMLRRFREGRGGEMLHDNDSDLARMARSADSFQVALAGVKKDIHSQLVTQAAIGTIDSMKLKLNGYRHISFEASKVDIAGVVATHYLTVMPYTTSEIVLKALIGDTKGGEIYLETFEADANRRTYKATIRFDIYDHFGVDEGDLYSVTWPGGNPLVAFWVLQHYRWPYRPFLNRIQLLETLEGSL